MSTEQDRNEPTADNQNNNGPVQEIGCPHEAWGMVVKCPFCGTPRHVSPIQFVSDRFLREVEAGKREYPSEAEAAQPQTAEERFHGMLGAWNDDKPLPLTIRAFADEIDRNNGRDFAGWTEVMRAWAHRIERDGEKAKREAIADFLDHDLPGLLAEALRRVPPPKVNVPTLYPQALIAAIRQRIAKSKKCGWQQATLPGEQPDYCQLTEGHTGEHSYQNLPAEIRSLEKE